MAEIFDLRTLAAFGVAGNFTGHLEQAGEAADFTKVRAEAGAPKAVFPTYLPKAQPPVPGFLGVFPFDERKIVFPHGEEKLQIEPECAVIFAAEWQDGTLSGLRPLCFGASNDCSIRKAGARKISEKKNWGPSSKGVSGHLLPLEDFSEKGELNRYRVASFLIRDGKVHAYGEDSAVRDYSYIYERLTAWLTDKFNHQADEGPAEDIGAYLRAAGCPEQLLVSIGATRYTDFGQVSFLKAGDTAVVAVYPEDRYSHADIADLAGKNHTVPDDISLLRQEVVLN